MNEQIKLRRSQLAVPASNERFIEKAAQSGADEAFLDLEDSVAPNQKKASRSNVVEGLLEHDWSEVTPVYRMNGVDTKWWYGDIVEIVPEVAEVLDTIMVPMANNPGIVRSVDNLLTAVEEDHGFEVGGIGLQCQIEHAEGMTKIKEVSRASDRIETLVFGPGDYTASVGAAGLTIGSGEGYPGHYWHYQLARIAHVAKANGQQVIDGPFADTEDVEGFRESCTQAARLGVDGKWAIHPSQVEPANEVFAPSRADADKAKRIVETYEQATESGEGAVKVDGEMVDEATRKMAAGIMERADRAGMYE